MAIGELVPWAAVLRTVCGPEVAIRHHVPVPQAQGVPYMGAPW